MLALFSRLTKFDHLIDADVLTFKGIQLQLYFVDQIDNACIAVADSLKVIETCIFPYVVALGKQALVQINIGAKNAFRVLIGNIDDILDGRIGLAFSLRTAKDQDALGSKNSGCSFRNAILNLIERMRSNGLSEPFIRFEILIFFFSFSKK